VTDDLHRGTGSTIRLSVSCSPLTHFSSTMHPYQPELAGSRISTEGADQMDLRGQQIIVQQHMNDRVSEARMARLARDSQLAARSFEQKPTPVRHQQSVKQSALSGFLGNAFDALAAVGRSLTPLTPVRVPVRR
jgi:hypothetical protein